ncbi:hypothetical protein HanRHA438_Chr14g0670661 [Helianthus annuus]|nr:hypothetical protein HanRHA438_Chr14g0670661 [Helianthus annuus]
MANWITHISLEHCNRVANRTIRSYPSSLSNNVYAQIQEYSKPINLGKPSFRN